MAHFARLDENNKVVHVIVVDDVNCLDSNGNESMTAGEEYCHNLLGGTWKKCSYNTQLGEHLEGGTPLRGNFPSAGWIYHADIDAFLPPKPYNSWVRDEVNFQWLPPIPHPTTGGIYQWDNDTDNWKLIYGSPSNP